MIPQTDFGPTIQHHIEVDAGLSNHIVLSGSMTQVAKCLIKQSEARILELKTLYAEERLRLKRLKTAIAPCKKLPIELVHRIIKETTRIYYNPEWTLVSENNGYTPNTRWAPWIFRQVCSTWRQAALSYHQFWNHLVFFGDPEYHDYPARLDFWLRNIGDTSYPISIFQGCPRDDMTLGDLLVETIILPCRQSLVCLEMSPCNSFFLLPSGSFPLLKKLRLASQSSDIYSTDHSSVFLGMDSLRSLYLRGYRPSLAITTIPLKQLTELTLQDPLDLSVIFQVLLRCLDSIVDLSIHVDINTDTFTDYEKPDFILPNLKLLSLRERISGTLPRPHKKLSLLHYLTLPSIVTLYIYGHTGDDLDFPAVPFLGLVQRSKCPLRILEITQPLPRIDSPLRWSRSEIDLSSLHCLTRLRTEYILFSPTTMSQIAAGDLIPQINDLWLTVIGTSSVERLTELIERRAANGDPPPYVVVHAVQVNSKIEAGHFVDTVRPFIERVRSCRGSMRVVVENDTGEFLEHITV